MSEERRIYRESVKVKFKLGRKISKKEIMLLITPSTPREEAVKLWARLEEYEYDSFEVISSKDLPWYGEEE